MRNGPRSASSARGTTDNSSSASTGPPYHGVREERVTTLSPSRAEIGTIASGVTPTAWSADRAASATAEKRASVAPASILFTATITRRMLNNPSR
jgi:hypothetical protein